MNDQDGVSTALEIWFRSLYGDRPAPLEDMTDLTKFNKHYYGSRHEMEMNVNEAYRTAIAHIKIRCETHKLENGKYPATLEVDDTTWETLRSGMHANKDADKLVIPLLEDQPFVAFAQQADPIRPLHMVTIVKKEKPA